MAMTDVAAVIAEFNPFHNGHAHLVAEARRLGASHVMAVMSGNFVQRGEPAVADKFVRTRCALAGGVDLVLELPLAHAMSSAPRFARGGVALLKATGIADTLVFGSESGDGRALAALAEQLDKEPVQRVLREELKAGITFAKARQLAVEHTGGREMAALLSAPNNALGVEYLRQARHIGWQPRVLTVPRRGSGHDALLPVGDTASATYLRGRPSDWAALEGYMPDRCAELLRDAAGEGLYPASPDRLETAILSHLRRLTPRQLAALPDLSEGLHNRMYGAIRQAATLEGLHMELKTKRYTLARIRRLVLAAFLGITGEDQEARPAYLRVLGFRPEGRELLARMGRQASLPVGTSLARLAELGDSARRQAGLEELAGDLYALALPCPPACGCELRAKVVTLD